MAVVGVVIAVAAVAAIVLLAPGAAESKQELFARVKRGTLVISVSESGTIKSREQVVLKSETEGRTTILSLIAEGTHVEPGDLLVELDSSRLKEQKTTQEISVLNAEANYIRARENREIARSQGISDVAQAKLDVQFAKLDLEKYTEGEYPKELQKAEANITLAREERERAKDEYDWSEKLKNKGYITKNELKADELALKRADLNFEQAVTEEALLKKYTYRRQVEKLRSDVDQSHMALERVQRRAGANNIQADADLKARESEFDRQKSKLAKTIDQIAKCRIKAPVAGMVVYATTGRGSWRGNAEPLEEGQDVRERQELIHLPTATAMMAEIKVQESSLRKVAVGMPVRITVDALPGKTLYGRVAKIGLLPDAQSAWLNPDLTVYSTDIHLDGNVEGLRPGMTCRAEIIVQRHEDAVYVPVQAVTRVGGKSTVYVKASSGTESRTVEVGLDNNRVIHIISGLEAGEMVLLAPPLEPASLSPENADGLGDMPDALRESIGKNQPGETPKAPEAGAGGRIDLSKLQNMSREERRKFFENLTPEQREAMRSQMGSQRGGRNGGRGRRGGGRRSRGEGTAAQEDQASPSNNENRRSPRESSGE